MGTSLSERAEHVDLAGLTALPDLRRSAGFRARVARAKLAHRKGARGTTQTPIAVGPGRSASRSTCSASDVGGGEAQASPRLWLSWCRTALLRRCRMSTRQRFPRLAYWAVLAVLMTLIVMPVSAGPQARPVSDTALAQLSGSVVAHYWLANPSRAPAQPGSGLAQLRAAGAVPAPRQALAAGGCSTSMGLGCPKTRNPSRPAPPIHAWCLVAPTTSAACSTPSTTPPAGSSHATGECPC
jgi:hypothetical protein